jgi:hypothetical protein
MRMPGPSFTSSLIAIVLEGGSHFFAGGYLADMGASDEADFGYLQATIFVLIWRFGD